jgi:hypothetical protein
MARLSISIIFLIVGWMVEDFVTFFVAQMLAGISQVKPDFLSSDQA